MLMVTALVRKEGEGYGYLEEDVQHFDGRSTQTLLKTHFGISWSSPGYKCRCEVDNCVAALKRTTEKRNKLSKGINLKTKVKHGLLFCFSWKNH